MRKKWQDKADRGVKILLGGRGGSQTLNTWIARSCGHVIVNHWLNMWVADEKGMTHKTTASFLYFRADHWSINMSLFPFSNSDTICLSLHQLCPDKFGGIPAFFSYLYAIGICDVLWFTFNVTIAWMYD